MDAMRLLKEESRPLIVPFRWNLRRGSRGCLYSTNVSLEQFLKPNLRRCGCPGNSEEYFWIQPPPHINPHPPLPTPSLATTQGFSSHTELLQPHEQESS